MRNSVRLAAAIAAVIALARRLQPRHVAERGGAQGNCRSVRRARQSRADRARPRTGARPAGRTRRSSTRTPSSSTPRPPSATLEYFSNAVEAAKAYDKPAARARRPRARCKLLKLGVAAPAPKDPAKRAELAGTHLEDGRHVRRGEVLPERSRVLQGPDAAHRRPGEQPQLRRADRSVDGLALDRAAAAQGLRALRRARERRRDASWASPTSARCGARVTTCRRTSSRRRPRVCGTRSSRCTTRCIATCADDCRRLTARSACRTASRFPRTCSATCGRSSGAKSIRWSSRTAAWSTST